MPELSKQRYEDERLPAGVPEKGQPGRGHGKRQYGERNANPPAAGAVRHPEGEWPQARGEEEKERRAAGLEGGHAAEGAQEALQQHRGQQALWQRTPPCTKGWVGERLSGAADQPDPGGRNLAASWFEQGVAQEAQGEEPDKACREQNQPGNAARQSAHRPGPPPDAEGRAAKEEAVAQASHAPRSQGVAPPRAVRVAGLAEQRGQQNRGEGDERHPAHAEDDGRPAETHGRTEQPRGQPEHPGVPRVAGLGGEPPAQGTHARREPQEEHLPGRRMGKAPDDRTQAVHQRNGQAVGPQKRRMDAGARRFAIGLAHGALRLCDPPEHTPRLCGGLRGSLSRQENAP